MKKFVSTLLFSLITIFAISQSYYNEWIDFNKTYYKFKVGSTGVYRINSTALGSIGLSNESAQNFQLWRNGKEVPLYTSVASGALGASGYIEFWGEKNDGTIDKNLYRQPEWQLSDKESLLTDTAAFFLTVNPTGNNLRFAATANNVSGNALSPEPYFMYSARQNFKNRIHPGRALVAGEYVYSSSYDIGEMWSTGDVHPGTPVQAGFSNLFVATNGPNATFRTSIAGSAPNYRNYRVELNGTRILDTALSAFDARVDVNSSVPLSVIASNNASINLINLSANVNDRIVFGFVELNYPRQFNFANQSTFTFSLPASASNKYVEINNFNSGGSTPVLYDLTNNRRYVADVAGNGTIRFVLQPSSSAVNFVLVSQAAGVINSVNAFQQRTFVNYSTTANQADYIIITHSSLQATYNGANQVDLYRAYRSSATGGSYNAKIYDVDQLIDQYGYGIKKNPLSIKNFLRYARTKFSIAPKFAFLVGKGMTYSEYRENEANPQADRLNLIPTWGYPASDILLASNNMDPIMNTPIGRLSIIYPRELSDYLDKVKQYEQAQQSQSQTIADKAWMKNIIHVVGANDASLDLSLTAYMRNYQSIIEDTLYGAKVFNFNKSTTGPVTPITSSFMQQLIENGISLLSYFGHSSASSLDYNLDNPENYNNTGKYPMFIVNGCNAGNLYSFDTARFSTINTLSEKYVLAKNKGSIGFIASTHFGITNYLDYYNTGLYTSIGRTGYGKSITYNINEAITSMLNLVGPNDFGGRLHAEETTLHGDPAIKMNSFAAPDFVVEEPQITINPNIVSVADTKFTVKATIYNIGKATGDSVTVQVKQQYPDGTSAILLQKRIRSIRYSDSLVVEVPIVASRDKGENRITVSVDTDNKYAELSEANNTATKAFLILEDELRPVYPYNYSIVNKTNIKLVASTASPTVASKQYVMEMDTTENFNSSLKVTRNTTAAGGLVEFDPGITFKDSTVYYWRVAPVPAAGSILWNNASFVYLNASSPGFNQSHTYQHLKSSLNNIYLDTTDLKWKFSQSSSSLFITHSIYPTSGTEDFQFSIAVNGYVNIASACIGHSVIFNLFDPLTMKPYYNQAQPSTVRSGAAGGFMGSADVSQCPSTRQYNFEFSYKDTANRRKMRDFMDWIPKGVYVTARLIFDPNDPYPYAPDWQKDEQVYGIGNSLYSRLKSTGFADIDSFSYPRIWAFVYKKSDPLFTPVYKFSQGLFDRIVWNLQVPTAGTNGAITSPTFGPAMAWKQVKWRGASLENTPGDVVGVNVIGVTAAGQADTLYRLTNTQQDFDISAVKASQYPYIRLYMNNQDSINLTPYQLRYWRLLYDPAPEGGLTSATYRGKDTLEVGEPLDFAIAFKNISDVAFRDSLKVNVTVYDKSNNASLITLRKKALQPADTIVVGTIVDTRALAGNNTLFIDVNPNLEQPEQYRFNNFMYKNFYVRPDTHNPLMDVTFDGVHILNGDIVSAKPKIVIKLKDESKYLALNDTSLTQVYVQYPGPNGVLKRYAFGTDTLRFVPADLSTGKNEATIEFSPAFLDDSGADFYQLIVKAKDKSGNTTGNIDYNVRFQVYTKAAISNMFNYPNPFTTSTAFVFTITGSDVPQNIRIQIMTVTGKIVKDITKQELGPLHIGRNITEYKWDGTDQYGQKLANGIYLYRVITNNNGASLEKFDFNDDQGRKIDTDKYFNKGYGKMYLMR
jgi:hypothetical protein